MTIRRVTEPEFERVLELSEYAFQYSVPNSERNDRLEKMKQAEIWGDYDGEELISKLHILPFQVSVDEKLIHMGGIASVATWPEHRRKGSVSSLLSTALASMKKNGQIISFLHPFQIGFYRHFGWELIASYKKYKIPSEHLFRYDHVDGRVRRLNYHEGIEGLNTVYEHYFKEYNGLLKRSTDWWKDRVLSKDIVAAVYYNVAGEMNGYVLYSIKDSVFKVEEMIYANEEARRGVWNFISQHDSMVKEVCLTLPESDRQAYLLKDPRISQTIHPYFMGRIVEVEAYLNKIGCVSAEPLTLTIEDRFAEWNTGTYEISTDGVKKVATQGDLCMDIQTFTAAMVGAVPLDFLYETEKIQGKKKTLETFQHCVSKKSTLFYDFF
ncbi:hypothetical protein Q75_09170 [Bacillus coahuilensis p1.1.43]|uniref:N-acetyltransferase domain-containing protein n=1 Tax=Bacillus coahuilensis p1.1.43 TaxID=1150625 RepID=A0A147K885_9BACI|nr:GNAT family N-acetyltransferase [Bacillus coahuilensis]KUP06299.1 hypothetical protein Q75_09170 [Bacillus coahuilensis p1.1.43]